MSDARYVLDASAVLAVIFREPGAENVAPMLDAALISSVNLSEIVAKLLDRGMPEGEIELVLGALSLDVAAFDAADAIAAGKLRASTRHAGLSLGDRACLALAIAQGAMVTTTDRAWAKLDLPLPVQLVRP